MRNGALQLSIVFAALVGLTVVVFEGTRLGQAVGLREADPVLVFVVASPESTRRIRKAVSPERVFWEGQAGLALVGARVIASNLDDAADVIEGAGWVDRPIQIVTLDVTSSRAGEEPQADPRSTEARLARLRELVHKPTLTRGEQVFVLQAMNDGLEI
jgi:hypothetical protein